MPNDADGKPVTTPEDEGSDDGLTPDPQGSTPEELVASYRKRQAGSEAARQAAEAKLRDANKELAAFRKATQSDEQKDLSENARLQANLEAAEKRADEAEAKATARVLDATFPNARKELPEVTDEVRLAKFEALLAEDAPEADPPTPLKHNEARPSTPAPKKEPTLQDLEAQVLASSVPEGW